MTSPHAQLPAELRAVRPWTGRDAQSWLAVRPPAWARPLGTVVVFALAWAVAMAVAPVEVHTSRSPADADWIGLAEGALAGAQLYWFLRLPELTLVSAPLLGAVVAYEEFPTADGPGAAAYAVVLAALGYGWWAALLRLRHRRRQRVSAQAAAGPETRPLPGTLPPLRRGRAQMAAGVLLCAAAAGSFWIGEQGVRADEAKARDATRVTAEVVARDDENVRIRMPSTAAAGAEVRTLDAYYADDYPVSGNQAVLVDGDWARLAAEPLDLETLVLWQLAGAVAAAGGISLIVFGALARRRATALRRGPVPVLRVLIRDDVEADTWVFAADDPEGRRPLFSCAVAEEDLDDEDDDEEDGEEVGHNTPGEEEDELHQPSPEEASEQLRKISRLQEAVLYGAPCTRAEVALASVTTDGELITECSFEPVRPARARWRTPAAPLAHEDEGVELILGSGATAHMLEVVAATSRTAQRMTTRHAPAQWHPDLSHRVLGAADVIIAAAVVGSLLVADYHSSWLSAFIVLMAIVVLTMGAARLNWRITADRDGLWMTGAWRVRHLPWNRLDVVVYEDGELLVYDRSGDTAWNLRVGPPKRWRRRGEHGDRGRQAAEEITAMRVQPELRPTRMSTRRERGLPLAPLLTLALLTWAGWALYLA
ncbi:hypothetical protein [Streptomyces sp. KR80]|uniref:hypothetical protein n=1 Tax=Streptomyces sp. KR80 TaxID=3457426 RepID=UPI003FD540DF